jgi:hypothetical protein
MQTANLAGRLVLLTDSGAVDVEQASHGRFAADPQSVSRLSAVLPLLPGDVLFTGTPAGVGVARSPQRFLRAGDELVSRIEGIGEMRHRLVAARLEGALAGTSGGGNER